MSTCKNCGKMVSPRATSCPTCGEPNPAKQSPSIAVMLLSALGLISITLFINGYYFLGIVVALGVILLFRLLNRINRIFKR
jgi:hypothetical protein